MNILSIDGSTHSSGIAIFKHNQLTFQTCITSASTDLFKRIQVMVNGVQQILSQNPDIQKVILEQVRPQNGMMNIKTHKALMYLQGCLAMMIYKNFKHIQIDYLYPSEWRKTCGIQQGRGVKRASLKQQDINFVKKKFNLEVNDDIADAICIGYAYIQENGSAF